MVSGLIRIGLGLALIGLIGIFVFARWQATRPDRSGLIGDWMMVGASVSYQPGAEEYSNRLSQGVDSALLTIAKDGDADLYLFEGNNIAWRGVGDVRREAGRILVEPNPGLFEHVSLGFRMDTLVVSYTDGTRVAGYHFLPHSSTPSTQYADAAQVPPLPNVVAAQIGQMRAALRGLRTGQEMYRTQFGRYAASMEEARDYLPRAFGVWMWIVSASDRGWRAHARLSNSWLICEMYDGVPRIPGLSPGQVACR
jgi:hypothetical protein